MNDGSYFYTTVDGRSTERNNQRPSEIFTSILASTRHNLGIAISKSHHSLQPSDIFRFYFNKPPKIPADITKNQRNKYIERWQAKIGNQVRELIIDAVSRSDSDLLKLIARSYPTLFYNFVNMDDLINIRDYSTIKDLFDFDKINKGQQTAITQDGDIHFYGSSSVKYSKLYGNMSPFTNVRGYDSLGADTFRSGVKHMSLINLEKMIIDFMQLTDMSETSKKIDVVGSMNISQNDNLTEEFIVDMKENHGLRWSIATLVFNKNLSVDFLREFRNKEVFSEAEFEKMLREAKRS